MKEIGTLIAGINERLKAQGVDMQLETGQPLSEDVQETAMVAAEAEQNAPAPTVLPGVIPEPQTQLELANGSTVAVAVDPADPARGVKQPTLGEQITQLRKEQTTKDMDPAKGTAEKQLKMDLTADKHAAILQIARRIGRELGVNGPITIDDVTEKMSEQYNVLPVKGKRHTWKGSVFTKSEWVYIGEVPSRQPTAHSRPVGLWALKSWLQNNTLNGRDTHVSSYVMSRLFRDFTHQHPQLKANLKDCNWYIGDERLAGEIRASITEGDNSLYAIPVSFVPGAIGALILPPNPENGVAPVSPVKE